MIGRKTIVVTGANGLLGMNLVTRLAQLSHTVHAIVRNVPELPVSGVEYHRVDLSANWSPKDLPQTGIDSVIHLAQSRHFRDVPEKALDVFNVNVASTARLLDYAWRNGARQFLYASSGGIYGSSTVAFSENTPLPPAGHLGYYLGSKLCGEVLTQSYASQMLVTVLRFFFIYGAGQNRSMLIPRLADSIRDGRHITLVGDEGLRVNPIHVSDAAAAVIAALGTKQSATYNIAGNEVVTLKQLCQKLERLIGRQGIFSVSPGDPKDIIADVSAMKADLHIPTFPLEVGLKDVL